MRKYISAILLLLAFNCSFAQKVDSLQLLKDVNGGGVAFTTIAANAVTWGNGYGTNNMAFIAKLRSYTTSTILPIILSSFKPYREANAVKLAWITSSERNSDYFEVLKSTDGKTFSAIGNVKAARNSNQNLTYNFKDLYPVKGTNYYQLNMVDLDGKTKKSIIVSSNFDINKADFNVFTDANKGTITLSVNSNKSKQAIFDVYDLSGKKLLNKSLILQNGVNNFEFKLNTNAKMIIVQLNCENDKQVKKLFY